MHETGKKKKERLGKALDEPSRVIQVAPVNPLPTLPPSLDWNIRQ